MISLLSFIFKYFYCKHESPICRWQWIIWKAKTHNWKIINYRIFFCIIEFCYPYWGSGQWSLIDVIMLNELFCWEAKNKIATLWPANRSRICWSVQCVICANMNHYFPFLLSECVWVRRIWYLRRKTGIIAFKCILVCVVDHADLCVRKFVLVSFATICWIEGFMPDSQSHLFAHIWDVTANSIIIFYDNIVNYFLFAEFRFSLREKNAFQLIAMSTSLPIRMVQTHCKYSNWPYEWWFIWSFIFTCSHQRALTHTRCSTIVSRFESIILITLEWAQLVFIIIKSDIFEVLRDQLWHIQPGRWKESENWYRRGNRELYL